MTPMDQLASATVLADMERRFENAHRDWLQCPSDSPERSAAWEHQNDLARLIRGHCKAYGLVPAVDVGGPE